MVPDHLPPPGSITIEEALRMGRKKIERPALWLTMAGCRIGLCLVFMVGLWTGILTAAGGLVAAYCSMLANTPAWRNWAYAGVADIHQFQRSAELAHLLPYHSYNKPYGWMRYSELQTFWLLQQRFETDTAFTDDLQVPAEVEVAFFGPVLRRMGIHFLVLSNAGIRLSETSFYAWDMVRQEEVVNKAYAGGGEFSDESVYRPSFCFSCIEGYIEIPLWEMSITPEALDHLLYTYRGRHEAAKTAAAG